MREVALKVCVTLHLNDIEALQYATIRKLAQIIFRWERLVGDACVCLRRFGADDEALKQFETVASSSDVGGHLP